MRPFVPCVLLVLFASVAACSDDSSSGSQNAPATPPPPPAPPAAEARHACDNRASESTCAEFPEGTTRAAADSNCDGDVLEGTCPTADVVGSCEVTTDDGKLINRYYGTAPTPHTTDDARSTCDEFDGTFVAP